MAICGNVFWLVFGANALIGVYNLMGGIAMVQNLIKGLELARFMIILVMMLIWVVLGTFLEWIAIMLLTLPIFLPIVKSLGYDPVWFGILFNINMQIAYLSRRSEVRASSSKAWPRLTSPWRRSLRHAGRGWDCN